jgi:hypothetical protein
MHKRLMIFIQNVHKHWPLLNKKWNTQTYFSKAFLLKYHENPLSHFRVVSREQTRHKDSGADGILFLGAPHGCKRT